MENLVIENINSKIYKIWGQKVILDRDLALFYQVETRRLKEQVKKNSQLIQLINITLWNFLSYYFNTYLRIYYEDNSVYFPKIF